MYVTSFAAMFVIYRGIPTNIYHHPVESVMGMFIMSLGEFADIYETFGSTHSPLLCKVTLKIHER